MSAKITNLRVAIERPANIDNTSATVRFSYDVMLSGDATHDLPVITVKGGASQEQTLFRYNSWKSISEPSFPTSVCCNVKATGKYVFAVAVGSTREEVTFHYVSPFDELEQLRKKAGAK